jgi:hypothetical protein
MLLLYLTTKAVASIMTILSCDWWPIAWVATQPFRMLVCAGVVFEVFRFGCLRLSRARRWRAIAWAVTGSMLCTIGLRLAVKLSPMQSFAVCRQFYQVILAVALVAFAVYIRQHPIAENTDHRYYRIIMAATMVRIGIGGVFVKSGFGYLLLAYSMRTWVIVDRLMLGATAMLTLALAYYMTSNISCLRPEVAAKRESEHWRTWGATAFSELSEAREKG